VALIRAEEAIDPDALGLSSDEATGAIIVRTALAAPAALIAKNAGYEGGVVVERIRTESEGMGFNAATGEWVDLLQAGVMDPAKVTRSALQNAASVAALLLTMECAVVEKREGQASSSGGYEGMH
jgi:chaperonin GroEL